MAVSELYQKSFLLKRSFLLFHFNLIIKKEVGCNYLEIFIYIFHTQFLIDIVSQNFLKKQLSFIHLMDICYHFWIFIF